MRLFKKKSSSSLPFIAFVQALGLSAYCTLVGLVFWGGSQGLARALDYSFLGPVMFLILFVVSALICALIVFGYAFILFWEKKQTGHAFKLVIFTGGWLIFLWLIFMLIFTFG